MQVSYLDEELADFAYYISFSIRIKIFYSKPKADSYLFDFLQLFADKTTKTRNILFRVSVSFMPTAIFLR
jgi:hypothetical protein